MGVSSHFYFGGKKIERINHGLLFDKPQTKLQKERYTTIFLIAQLAYLLSMLTLVMALIYGSPGKFWFMAGQMPFLVSMAWLAYTSARGMARLEEQRWQEEQRETEIKA